MYRLLIVDDEPFIVDWVYELFQQNHELELDIYKAYSGLEAISLLKRAKVDIVLSDIKMPDMDGLQLLKEINSSWPMCKVIFLTAHNEFEYAHIASKGGASYLLKTESDEEILRTVAKAARELDNMIHQEELVSSAEKQMKRARPIMQKEYLVERLKGSIEAKTLQTELAELGIPLSAKEKLLLLIGRTDDWYQPKLPGEKARQSAILQAIAQKIFEPLLHFAFLQLDNSMMVWLLQPAQWEESVEDWERILMFMRGSLELFQDQCEKNLSLTCSFALDNSPCSWEALSHCFSSLVQWMNNAGSSKQGMLLVKEQVIEEVSSAMGEYEQCVQRINIWEERENLMLAFLESGQKSEFYKLLGDMKLDLRATLENHGNLRMEFMLSMARLFLGYINQYGVLVDKLTAYPELFSLMNINNGMSCEDLFENYQKTAAIIFDFQQNDRENNDSRMIATLHQYIQQNLDKDLSLVRLAEVVYLNPAYLSRVYKQITGGNLSEYIFQQRLEKAKRLLQDSRLKIQEIAGSVGFDSSAYFIRTFKKNFGMPPQEYRETIIAKRSFTS